MQYTKLQNIKMGAFVVGMMVLIAGLIIMFCMVIQQGTRAIYGFPLSPF